MSTNYEEDYCEAWPVGTTKPEDKTRTSVCFSIAIDLWTVCPQPDDQLEIDDFGDELVDEKIFEVERDQLMKDDISPRLIVEDMLLAMNIPVKPLYVEKILACARNMANDDIYSDSMVLRVQVWIRILVDEPPMRSRQDDYLEFHDASK